LKINIKRSKLMTKCKNKKRKREKKKKKTDTENKKSERIDTCKQEANAGAT
jgi:hypothetical protein